MEDRRSATLLVTLATAACFTPFVAHSTESLAQCSHVPDDAERLACYDRLSGRAPTVRTESTAQLPAPVRASAVASGPTTVLDPVAAFGLSQQEIEERDPTGWTESITGTVGSVSQAASGRYVVTLGNGQAWIQTNTDSYPVLKTGDAVEIRRAALGSYVLNGPRSISWRVRRVR